MVDARLESVTTRLSDVKRKTLISTLSALGGEIFPPAYPTNVVMSVIPRDYKVARKSDDLPELCGLRLIDANYKKRPTN